MTSLRGRLLRQLVRRAVGPRFRRAGSSVARLRELEPSLVRAQRLPRATEVSAVAVDGVHAEWVRAPGSRAGAALLYLHGGAFVIGSPATHRELAARLSMATRLAALSPAYRLAPEHPFPAALEDALGAYRWLRHQAIPPERIVIAGDSSGGGLALQTLLALRDEGDPLPAAALLLSPQADWVRLDGESYDALARRDPLQTPEQCRHTAALYVGGSDPESPLLCPLAADLSGLPALCIHVGDRDLLLSDSLRLAERARACGVAVELAVWPGMWHVFHAAARFVPEARRSLAALARFAEERLGAVRPAGESHPPEGGPPPPHRG